MVVGCPKTPASLVQVMLVHSQEMPHGCSFRGMLQNVPFSNWKCHFRKLPVPQGPPLERPLTNELTTRQKFSLMKTAPQEHPHTESQIQRSKMSKSPHKSEPHLYKPTNPNSSSLKRLFLTFSFSPLAPHCSDRDLYSKYRSVYSCSDTSKALPTIHRSISLIQLKLLQSKRRHRQCTISFPEKGFKFPGPLDPSVSDST